TRAGTPTVIKELDAPGVERAKAHVGEQIAISAKRTRTPERRYRALLAATTDMADIAGADLVIEAVFEDLALKRSVLAEVEQATGPDTVFATNTSSIPITEIAAGAARPGNVVGMHYFSPVEKMPLLEVVAAPATSEEAIATAVAVGRAQGKTVIVVSDGPGFYTTRILTPYGAEVMRLLEDGALIEDVDGAMVEWGFPVGPLALNDEVGLDVTAKIALIMQKAFGERVTPRTGYEALLADGRMGRKNGLGFYRYEQGKRVGADPTVYEVLGTHPTGEVSRAEIRDRLVAAMVNEAARCLEEGVLDSAVDGDLGAVMGIGFPPFRGGPFFYIDETGVDVIVSRLDRLAGELGPHFAPAAILREQAASGSRFRP
ncbi:MAG: 3-hydroxyacyl-CoA dehydrogenase NAD-binding domain-containing protein, partial [Thermoanaerobaculia bacterium]|nr:3-hydroxyacyl-CoA dehydrogenase NAD-binding domain-containing protein [Thermoanaerobaculia bacterium]